MRRAMDGARRLKTKNTSIRCFEKSGWILIRIFTILSSLAFASMSFASFRAYPTHTHLTFPTDPQVQYTVDKIENAGRVVGLRVRLDNLPSSADLIKSLENAKDERTESIHTSVTPKGNGSELVVEILFSEKARQSGIEYFEYTTKTPYSLKLDYWLKTERIEPATNSKTIAQMSNMPEADNSKPAVTAQPTKDKRPLRERIYSKKLAKKPVLSTKEKTTVSYLGCDQSLQLDKDPFVMFKVWHVPYDYRKFFNLMPADQGYEYPFSKPKKGEEYGVRKKEVAHYRLAVKLYNESQFALVLRTIAFFEKSFPQSPLLKELEFLKANTYLQLSRLLKSERYQDLAYELYRKMIIESPESNRAQKALAFMVQELMESQQYYKALEYALMGANSKEIQKQNETLFNVYQLASAECLYELGEYDRAERMYQVMMDQKNKMSDEAAFRVGEVYTARKFWERAAISEELSNKKMTKESVHYPSNQLNLGENYFKLKRYADARRAFQEFLVKYPSANYSWIARLRLAEIAHIELKPNAKKSDVMAVENLYETVINRNPYSPGAELAELRLSQCHFNHTGDKLVFFKDYFESRNLKAFEDALIEPAEVEVFYDLASTRFYASINDDLGALNTVDRYRSKYIHLPLAPEFLKVYQNVSDDLIVQHSKTEPGEDLTQSQAKKVLELKDKYNDVLPEHPSFGLILALSKAQFALGDLSQVSKFNAQLKLILGAANDDQKDEYYYLSARFHKISGASAEDVMSELAKIRGDATGGGPLSAIKIAELAKLSLAKDNGKGNLQESTAYFEMLLQKDLYKKLPVSLQISSHVQYVENLFLMGKKEQLVKHADMALIKFGLKNNVDKEILRIKELRAQALYDIGDNKQALIAFGDILQNQPKHARASEFEFNRAKILLKLGREDEALETLKKLASSTSDNIWKKSAQDELDQLQWEDSRKVSNQ